MFQKDVKENSDFLKWFIYPWIKKKKYIKIFWIIIFFFF